MEPKARELAARTHELIAFMTGELGIKRMEGRFEGAVTYHHSCSSLREIGIRDEARDLLVGIEGLELRELDGAEQCCGFGGTFCVKYPEI